MAVQKLELIILQQNKPHTIDLAEIHLNDLPKQTYFISPGALDQTKLEEMSTNYTPLKLVQSYLDSIQRITNLLHHLLPVPVSDKRLHKILSEVPFSFVSNKAYEKIKPCFEKEKADDAEIISCAYYDHVNGIYVSIKEEENIMQGAIIHEHGHYLHDKLYSKAYQECDATMKEIIAIFVQEECGFPRDYRENTPHYRAKDLLQRCRQHAHMKTFSPASFWDLIMRFKHHENLDKYISSRT